MIHAASARLHAAPRAATIVSVSRYSVGPSMYSIAMKYVSSIDAELVDRHDVAVGERDQRLGLGDEQVDEVALARRASGGSA